MKNKQDKGAKQKPRHRRGTAKKAKFTQSSRVKLGMDRSHHSLRGIALEFWEKYFGANSPENRESAKSRLGRWEKLQTTCIPDSGADHSVMAGDAWLLYKVPGVQLGKTIRGWNGDDRHLKLMKGQTTYLSPEGKPLAVLQVNWGLADPNQGESLLAESQILDAGMRMNNFHGLKQFSSPGWSMPIHCLPRGPGHFIPIRKPTKEDIANLPVLELTGGHNSDDKMLDNQVKNLFDALR
jgi:hypothetical protein